MGVPGSEGFASIEDLEAAEFDFGEEIVVVKPRGKELRLKLRELSVGRQGKLLSGLLDKEGRVTDLTEVQTRQIAAYCVEPVLDRKKARQVLVKWPSTALDPILEAIKKLGGEDGEEASETEDEFPGSEE